MSVVWSAPGAQLVEHSFEAHLALLDAVVEQARPNLLARPTIVVFNREVQQPRDVGFFSNASSGYHYSRRVMKSQPLTTEMAALLELVNGTLDAAYNSMLVNLYRDGHDRVGAHSDEERALDTKAGVVALSWGATRKFRIRDKATKSILVDAPSRHGFALCMRGPAFQRDFTHEIPTEARIRGERVSITFRKHDA